MTRILCTRGLIVSGVLLGVGAPTCAGLGFAAVLVLLIVHLCKKGPKL